VINQLLSFFFYCMFIHHGSLPYASFIEIS